MALMEHPCKECPSRNVICVSEQLFMKCKPWEEYESQLLEKLIDGTVVYVPQPKRKWRWLNGLFANTGSRMGA